MRTSSGCGLNGARLPGLVLAYDIAYETLLATLARRDRRDAAITEMAAYSVFTPS